jgi:hypothetical protein
MRGRKGKREKRGKKSVKNVCEAQVILKLATTTIAYFYNYQIYYGTLRISSLFFRRPPHK